MVLPGDNIRVMVVIKVTGIRDIKEGGSKVMVCRFGEGLASKEVGLGEGHNSSCEKLTPNCIFEAITNFVVDLGMDATLG